MRSIQRVRLSTLAALSMLAATGCFGDSHGGAMVHTTGRIVTVGGPPPGAPKPIAGAEFRLVGADESADVRAGSDGRFAVDLAPGRYRVVVTGHAPRSDGGWLPTTPSELTIAPTPAASIRLVVSIR